MCVYVYTMDVWLCVADHHTYEQIVYQTGDMCIFIHTRINLHLCTYLYTYMSEFIYTVYVCV